MEYLGILKIWTAGLFHLTQASIHFIPQIITTSEGD